MRAFLDKLGLVGSAGQSPVAFRCSFAVSLPATASILQTGGGTTSAPGMPDLLASSDSGAGAADDITSDTTPVFRVGLPPQAIEANVVRVYRTGSTEIGSKTLDATDIGNGFADVVATTLASGAHTITAKVENAAGLSLPGAGLALTVDAVQPDAPSAIVVTPAQQGTGPLQTNALQPTFRVSLPANAAAGDVATLQIGGVDDAAASLTGTDLSNGYVEIQAASALTVDTVYDISAYLTDLAGNQGNAGSAVQVEIGDADGNAIPAVVYDGVQGYLKHTGGPAGAADGAALTAVWAGTFNSDGSAMTLLDIPGTVPVRLSRQADDTILFEGGAAGAVFSNETAAVAASLGFLVILASCNGTSSTLKVVHAAGTITGSNTAGSAGDLDLTADWFLGAAGGASAYLDADTALWWIDDAAIDFTDADNIEQFWDTAAHTLRDPGAAGANPTDGAAPLVCHKSVAATHSTNAGTGGDADTAGIFTDGTSLGTYAEDYVSASAATIALMDTKTSAADGTVYTFTGVDIGAVASDRIVAVTVHSENTVGDGTRAVTIGGNAATEIESFSAANGSARTTTAIFALAVPSGTNADVVVTWERPQVRTAITVYRITGIPSLTPHDTDFASGTSDLDVTLTIPDGSIVLAAATANNATTFTWFGVTERADGTIETCAFSSASDVFATGADAALSATAASGSVQDTAVFASWGP